MTHKEMFGSAKWVAPEVGCDQPTIRGAFSAPAIEAAEITLCGLGFFELYINGQRVEEDYFVPGWTDYEDHRFENGGQEITDRFAHRIYCVKYDITPFIKAGENIIGVVLGAGWYKEIGYGDVKLCYTMTLTGHDGNTQTIHSNTDLKWAQSPITQSRMLKGETHDYRLEAAGWNTPGFDDSAWQQVKEVRAPESDFLLWDCPPDRVIRKLAPKVVKRFLNYTIYDAGENITGWPVIELLGKKGSKAVAYYAEELGKTGLLNSATYTYKHSRKRMQMDTYISDGKKHRVHPHFVWHAFRYFSVTNNARPLSVAVVHSNVAVTSAFECGNKSLNWLYDAFIRTQLCNMHAGIPSDCPQREGRGYTGDGQLVCDAAMLLLDGQKFYKKWLGDIADCQDKKTGHVQYTAPYWPSGGGPGGWGCAIVEVPYTYYLHYGDKAMLEEFFPKMLRYFDYLEAHSEDGLITSDYPGAWCLGDWCTPDDIKIPAPLVNNYFYIKSLFRVLEIASIIGREDIFPEMEKRITERKAAIEKTYYNADTGDFADDIQGANSFAVDIGLGGEKTFNNITEKYKKLGMYDTGIFGTDILTRILFERTQGQLAFDLLAGEKKVSFHTMMAAGATTLWEYWSGKKSHSHPMFGAVTRYLYYYLLGIRQTADSTEFAHIVVEPVIPDGLDFATGHITTRFGIISVAWQKQTDTVLFTIEIPPVVQAKFTYNGKELVLNAGINSFSADLRTDVGGKGSI